MIKEALVTIISILTTGSFSYAQGVQSSEEMNLQLNRDQFKTALPSLIDSGAVECLVDSCSVKDEDLLQQLRASGIIHSRDFTTASICAESDK